MTNTRFRKCLTLGLSAALTECDYKRGRWRRNSSLIPQARFHQRDEESLLRIQPRVEMSYTPRSLVDISPLSQAN